MYKKTQVPGKYKRVIGKFIYNETTRSRQGWLVKNEIDRVESTRDSVFR